MTGFFSSAKFFSLNGQQHIFLPRKKKLLILNLIFAHEKWFIFSWSTSFLMVQLGIPDLDNIIRSLTTASIINNLGKKIRNIMNSLKRGINMFVKSKANERPLHRVVVGSFTSANLTFDIVNSDIFALNPSDLSLKKWVILNCSNKEVGQGQYSDN